MLGRGSRKLRHFEVEFGTRSSSKLSVLRSRVQQEGSEIPAATERMLRQDAFLRSVVPANFSSKELADMLRFSLTHGYFTAIHCCTEAQTVC